MQKNKSTQNKSRRHSASCNIPQFTQKSLISFANADEAKVCLTSEKREKRGPQINKGKRGSDNCSPNMCNTLHSLALWPQCIAHTCLNVVPTSLDDAWLNIRLRRFLQHVNQREWQLQALLQKKWNANDTVRTKEQEETGQGRLDNPPVQVIKNSVGGRRVLFWRLKSTTT